MCGRTGSAGRLAGMRLIRWRVARSAVPLAAVALLAGCAAGADATSPTWVPQPSVTLEAGPRVSLPNQPGQQPGGPTQVPGPGGPPSQSGRPGSGPDPNVVATHLNAPTGITLLPDGTALVGERSTGRIVRVQPQAGKPVVTVRTLLGLNPAGDGGLLDLALSPTYDEDGLVYAYVTTSTDNRVIDFTLTGPATPVLTGIPRGANDNTGRLMFDSHGILWVGTGDAGQPHLAADSKSLAGKVLRVNAIGQPASGNPVPGSSIYTRGHRTVNGLCQNAPFAMVYETEAPGEINLLDGGTYYGWPTRSRTAELPVGSLPAGHSGASDCAVLGGRLYVATSDGRSLLSAATSPRTPVGKFSIAVDGRYGRLRTVVAAPDGALWLTTTNKDGHGNPVADDERVLRIIPSAGGGNSPPL
jgi:glucose/arabinose dehydrogenase